MPYYTFLKNYFFQVLKPISIHINRLLFFLLQFVFSIVYFYSASEEHNLRKKKGVYKNFEFDCVCLNIKFIF